MNLTHEKFAIFLVLAMVLRRKPDVLLTVLPKFMQNSKYQGQDKLPFIIWMIVQACQGDLAVGLYLWAHHILPILGGKSGSNPQCRDLVLQLVESMLAAPKARVVLVNNAVRKGERLIAPESLDLLLRLTFPASPARVKATERFEAIYPILKEVALTGSPGSKAMNMLSNPNPLTFDGCLAANICTAKKSPMIDGVTLQISDIYTMVCIPINNLFVDESKIDVKVQLHVGHGSGDESVPGLFYCLHGQGFSIRNR
ncbi:uncharacterized protein [Primulina eburnea]|uniref:uncharacterized protein n=1 Tax=Primulina eburnea TaxID=1245227 RepID=UPI003C6CA96F